VIARLNSSRVTPSGCSARQRSAVKPPVWLDVPAFTAFSQEVQDRLTGEELTYSQRLRLLKRAEHFGIRRFDANLIIAMVQSRIEKPRLDAVASNAQVSNLSVWTVAGVVQCLIIAAGWWLLR
jgi:hypothetical protein